MAEAQGQVETQPALTALNPHEAIAVIATSLEADEVAATTPRDESGKFTKKAEPQTDEAKPETEAAKETEEAPAPEEEQVEAQPEPRKLKLKYKGEEKEVDENEAIELAQKGFDYTQKSQALAKEREEIAAKVKAESEAARAKYEQQLEIQKQTVLKLVDQEALNADLNKLAVEDPAKAQQLFFRKLQIQQTLQSIEAQQNQLAQQRQQEMQAAMEKSAKESVEKLQERIPGWNNDLYGKVLKAAQETYGFQAAEVNAITDHRAIEVLNDARQWREYQAAKPRTVEKRVASVPKVQKPGSAEKTDPNANRVKDSMAQLEKSGTRDAAHEYALALMKAGRL